MKPSCYLTAWWGSGTLTDKRVKKDNDLNSNCHLNFFIIPCVKMVLEE